MELREIKISRPVKLKTLLHPKGAWFSNACTFRYHMVIPEWLSRKEARIKFIEMALKEYNESDKSKAEHVKWLLNLH